jgi:ribosomal protein S18 acetylase RimI-like enzyme
MPTNITVYHLEMTDPRDLRPKRSALAEVMVRRVEGPFPELNRFFYSAVGGDWYWMERLAWAYDKWMNYVDRPELQTWVGSVAGVPFGYFELEVQAGGNVEIVYFGLLPQFIGRGLGGHLLTAAAERAWEAGARRVWLHTCTLDHPSALANYQARGFRVFKEVQKTEDLPAQPPGPWPGAGRDRAAGVKSAPANLPHSTGG